MSCLDADTLLEGTGKERLWRLSLANRTLNTLLTLRGTVESDPRQLRTHVIRVGVSPSLSIAGVMVSLEQSALFTFLAAVFTCHPSLLTGVQYSSALMEAAKTVENRTNAGRNHSTEKKARPERRC